VDNYSSQEAAFSPAQVQSHFYSVAILYFILPLARHDDVIFFLQATFREIKASLQTVLKKSEWTAAEDKRKEGMNVTGSTGYPQCTSQHQVVVR
jgi:hypothetical protein